MIADETIQKVADANDIVDVIGSYVKLQRAGTRFRALCPFHNEKSPSFFVTPDRQTYHCFGCGAGGTVFRFIMEHDQVDFPTAVRRLAEKAGIPIIEEQLSREDAAKLDMRKRLLALHAETADYFHKNLLKHEDAGIAREYLKSRGITSEVAKSWKLGYALDGWDGLLQFAKSAGYNEDELRESGLLNQKEEGQGRMYDRFRNRLMFPICNDIGEVVAFSGRVLEAEAKEAKYVNSPETRIFTKGRILFGLHKSKRDIIKSGTAIVCEGQLDLITMFEAGIRNVIAPQGTAFTPDQARIIKRVAENVVLCFDSDNAGQKAMERSFEVLLAAEMDVRIASLPDGEDPDSLIRSQGPQVFEEIVKAAPDFFEFRIRRARKLGELDTARGKVTLANKIMGAVSQIEDPALRDQIVGRVAMLLEIGADDLRGMARRRQRETPQAQDGETREAPLPVPPADVRQLVQMVVNVQGVAAWLSGQDTAAVRDQLEETAILWTVLALVEANGGAADARKLTSSLSGREEALLTRILESPVPVAEEQEAACWRSIQRKALQQKMGAVKARLKAPDLPVPELIKLQKEVLDLQAQLTDITRPSL